MLIEIGCPQERFFGQWIVWIDFGQGDQIPRSVGKLPSLPQAFGLDGQQQHIGAVIASGGQHQDDGRPEKPFPAAASCLS